MQRRHAAWGVIAAAGIALTGSAHGEEIVVQNDRLADGGTAAICPCFAAGEEAAAWLTSPCDGNIVAVQIFWSTQFGGAKPSLEDSITLYEAGSFPVPGAELVNGLPPFPPAFFEGPVMINGGLNEFRFLDENNSVPLSVPIAAGETFVVSFKFFNANAGDIFAPSVASDANGCQPGRNAVFALPGGWLNACTLGVSGDWVIRAVVDCAPGPPGACCLASGSCTILESGACASAGGSFLGSGTACDGSCPDPVGACCATGPIGICEEQVTEFDCSASGGVWQGAATECLPGGCITQGACCIPATGGCADVTESTCVLGGGLWQGLGSGCQSLVCFPVGGCCLPDGSCADDFDAASCAASSGIYQGDETTCSTTQCPDPQGACCFSNGNCSPLSETNCDAFAGAWGGPASTCEDADQNGTADTCKTSKCPSDIDGNGAVDVTDLVIVITTWNQVGGSGDVNGDGTVDVLDLVEVILAWGPC